MVERQRFSDALASLMFVILLLMPFGSGLTVLVAFAIGVIPALVFYRSTLSRSDGLALLVAAAVATFLAAVPWQH